MAVEKGVGEFGRMDCARDSNKISSRTTTPMLETLLNFYLFSKFKGHANEIGRREHVKHQPSAVHPALPTAMRYR
jgi:hypothetical protein